MTEWTGRIAADRNVCHGKPCIKGNPYHGRHYPRQPCGSITPEEIITQYPPLTLDDIRAAMGYAATLAREEELLPLR
jgi:uncharacterized protein (DUF433 family)